MRESALGSQDALSGDIIPINQMYLLVEYLRNGRLGAHLNENQSLSRVCYLLGLTDEKGGERTHII